MAKVFVMGAAVPNGGTYMAYHVGRIVSEEFGFEPIGVRVGSENWQIDKHDYVAEWPLISVSEMEHAISEEDTLIANPSFSQHMFGFRIPGRKICYVQGFNTFPLLDARFDLYVSVSGFVRDFLQATYGLPTQIVAPFLESYGVTPPTWLARPRAKPLVYLKNRNAEVFFDQVRRRLGADIDVSSVLRGASLPREELLRLVGEHRYFLSLSAAEGFGLVPIEAMSLGAVVTGFDGFGGRDFLRSGENCLVSAYPDVESVARQLEWLVGNNDEAMRLSEAGRETARAYTYENFRESWRRCLTAFFEAGRT